MTSLAREVMDVEQVADYIGVSRTTLYEMISTYDGPPFVPVRRGEKGRRVCRFRKSAVDEWLKAREVRCADDERRLLDGRRSPKR